jgi:hypothetical protein
MKEMAFLRLASESFLRDSELPWEFTLHDAMAQRVSDIMWIAKAPRGRPLVTAQHPTMT